MISKKNESPTFTGRQATAQGAVAEEMPIEINGVILTEDAIDLLQYIQQHGGGEAYVKGLRDVSRHLIYVTTKDYSDSCAEEVLHHLQMLSNVEDSISRLIEKKKEVCDE